MPLAARATNANANGGGERPAHALRLPTELVPRGLFHRSTPELIETPSRLTGEVCIPGPIFKAAPATNK